jgi:phage shock protein PspC (stress-responsive transcriptional regulator)
MKRLYLSKTDKKIFGLCGGLGEMLDIDPTLIRLGAVFLCLLTGVLPLVGAYLIGWLIVPEEVNEYSVESRPQNS